MVKSQYIFVHFCYKNHLLFSGSRSFKIICILSCLCLTIVTPWTGAWQALLTMEIFQARILKWVAMPSSRGSSQTRAHTQVSLIAANSLPAELPRNYLDRCKLQVGDLQRAKAFLVILLSKKNKGMVSEELNASLCPDIHRLKIRLPWLESVIILRYFGYQGTVIILLD